MSQVVDGIAGLRKLVGAEVGPTDWVEVTQEVIDTFAKATLDHQWIHCDPERAKDGPFGGTIAHGYYTLALAPWVVYQLLDIQNVGPTLNYGCGKVRFTAPVPVNSRLRGHVTVAEIEDKPAGAQTTYRVTIEIEGAERPACVADVIWIYSEPS